MYIVKFWYILFKVTNPLSPGLGFWLWFQKFDSITSPIFQWYLKYFLKKIIIIQTCIGPLVERAATYIFFILTFFPQDDAEHMCKVIRDASLEKTCKPSFTQCWCSGEPKNSFEIISNEMSSIHGTTSYADIDTRKKVTVLPGLDYILTIIMWTFCFMIWHWTIVFRNLLCDQDQLILLCKKNKFST